MDTDIIAAAKYLIYVMVVGFATVWLFAERRRGKVELVLAAIIGLIVVLILAKIASMSYVNERPFVVDPSLTPLIPHAPDNGFPSNHASAAGLMATLIAIRHRLWGALFVLAAIGVAWGRVAAHVHHVLDVGAGLGLGLVAGVLGAIGMTILLRHTPLLRLSPVRRFIGDDGRGGADPHGGRHRSR